MSDRKLPMERSERLLNELLKIPVNTICCDCGAANPKWASTSIEYEEPRGMEQYIRAKYERKEFMESGGGGGHQPSRSAYGNSFSGGGGNGVTNSARYTDQVRALREMGFTDNARNLQVLQSTDGDVQAAVEILCRIGSGPANLMPSSANSSSRSQTLSPSNSTAAARRSSPMNTGSSGGGGKPDPKEAILWNMGFHDTAMNREALRRAGGNAEVAAGILIDEKDKIAKAVREKGGSSPLPAPLSPPTSKNSSSGGKKEDLLVDLGPTEEEKQQQLQQQQQQQQALLMQRQMQMLQQQQAQGTLDNNQLQAILNTNANLLAMFESNNNNNNNNNMDQMGMGGMGNMNTSMNNQNIFSAGAMGGGVNSNQNTANLFGTNANMFQQQQQQPATSQAFDNLWSMANTGAMTSAPMSSTMNSNPFSQMPTSTPSGTLGPNAAANMFGTPISSAGANNMFASGGGMGGGMSQNNPFATTNNNMFGATGQQNLFGSGTPTTPIGGMNMGMGMGMNMGQGTLNSNPMGNMGMGGMSPNPGSNPMGANNQFNNAFGFNNPPNQNQNQNNNWGMF
ncbi:hypothetical protein BGW41_002382 [Actinomortierella wolfii]|nr:hypothetical protein BGW41_002382 [Actinomortierella wolfii]